MKKRILSFSFIFIIFLATVNFAASDYLGSTFFGTNSQDSISFLKVAPNGDVYVAGVIGYLQLKNVKGFDTDYSSNAEKLCFIARFDSNLKTLKNFTYIGDTYSYPYDFKISPNGDVYILTFPHKLTVENVKGYDTTFSKSGQLLIRFDSNLENIKNYTYLENNIDDSDYYPNFRTFVIDNNGDIIVGGNILIEITDVAQYKSIIAKFSSDLTTAKGYKKFSKFSGIRKIKINNNNELVVMGYFTEPSDFKINQKILLSGEKLNVQKGVFLSKFDKNLTHLKTVLVASGRGSDITFDNDDNIYISIRTNSSYFVNDSSEKPVILKLDNNFSKIENFYTINFSIGDYVSSIKFKNNKLYITGATFQRGETNFPFTDGAWKPEAYSHSTGMILVMNSDLSKIDYATVIGGYFGADVINSMDITNDNILYVAGYAQTSNFPTSEGVYQATCKKGYGGSCYDAFIAKFYPSALFKTNLQVKVSGTHVTMTWDNVNNYKGYILYYAPYPYKGKNTIGSIDLGNLTSLDFNLPIGSAYYIAILPYKSNKEYGNLSNIELIQIK